MLLEIDFNVLLKQRNHPNTDRGSDKDILSAAKRKTKSPKVATPACSLEKRVDSLCEENVQTNVPAGAEPSGHVE